MNVNKFVKITIAVLLIFISGEIAISSPPYKGDSTDYIFKNAYLNRIDSMIIFEYTAMFNYSIDKTYNFYSDSLPVSVGDQIKSRLKNLNDETPIDLVYNDVVHRYINMYLENRKDLVAKMVGSAKLYYPIFEEKLDKYDLPLELKHLAVVESALNPLARSTSGAIGLWQFLYDTGTMMGLKVTSYVDERRDPYKSTEAACQYLEFLYNTFNDWQLALAAYNGGPTVVRNAIILSGGKTNYWEIRPYLPAQTQGYVPAFIAVNYVMSYYKEYGIKPVDPLFLFYNTDTITINRPVSLSTISENLDIPLANLKFLNPVYKQYFIPESSLPARLVLPKEKVADFLKLEHSVFSEKVDDNESLDKGEKYVILKHVVTKGEYLHMIALEYKCSIENIKEWNHLVSDALSSGQILEIRIPGSQAYRYNEVIKTQKNTNSPNDPYVYYTMQKEDDLEVIVGKFSGLTYENVLEINNIKNKGELMPGSKVKIDYKR